MYAPPFTVAACPPFPAVAKLIDGGISTGTGVGAVGIEEVDVGTGVRVDAGEGGGSGGNEASDLGGQRGRAKQKKEEGVGEIRRKIWEK